MPQYHKKQKQAEVYHSPKKQKIVYNINSQVDKFVTELDSAGTAVVFIPNVKDGSSVTLLKDLKKNQQRLYYLHVEIICITQTTAEEIDEVKKVEEIDFQITNQDALKYARLFGTENKEKIKRSAFLLVGSTLRKKYNSFNAIGLADTIIRDAAIMVDLDEVSFEESIAQEEDPIIVFYPNNAEIIARGVPGVGDFPAPHQNPANGGGVVRNWNQVDAEIQNNGGGANNAVGERIGNGIPGCWMYRFSTHQEKDLVLHRLKDSLPWTAQIVGRASIAHYIIISSTSARRQESRLQTVESYL